MKEQDFYYLRIGQEIYVHNKKVKIYYLSINQNERCICFGPNEVVVNWKNVCSDCSLEAPKPKRKLYRHIYEDKYYNLKALYSESEWEDCKMAIDDSLIETQIIWEEK